MQTADNDNKTDIEAGEVPRKPLSPAARRALAEAEERRKAEIQPDLPRNRRPRRRRPSRFGDWEINGRTIDF